MEIFPASVNDIPVIQHIASLTWPHAYAEILTPGQVGYMLNMMYSSSTLRTQMEEEGHHFFVLYKNSEPVGFAGISSVDYTNNQQEEKKNCWKLHKLYVLPNLQKSGAGKALMEKCMSLAKQNNGDLLILNVNRQNPAYHYYLAKGFEVLEEVNVDIGEGFYMNDYVMGKPLTGE